MNWLFYFRIPPPPPYERGKGMEYSKVLADRAQSLSLSFLVVGWGFVLSGVLLAIMGTTMRGDRTFQFDAQTVPDESAATPVNQAGGTKVEIKRVKVTQDLAGWFGANYGLVCGIGAVMSAGIGWSLLDRSAAAALLTIAATEAIDRASTSSLEDADLRAYKRCVHAKVNWLEGRMNHDRILNITNSYFKDGKVADKPVAYEKPPNEESDDDANEKKHGGTQTDVR